MTRKTKPNDTTLIAGFAKAKVEFGLSERAIIKQYLRMRGPKPKMLLSEYLSFGLYDPNKKLNTFIGAQFAAKLAYDLNRFAPKRAIIADKLLWDAALRGLGFPVPELQAVYGGIAVQGAQQLNTRADVRRFLANDAVFPLFGKPTGGQNSRSVVALAGYDAAANELIHMNGTREKAWTLLRPLEDRHYKWGYLFQSFVEQHPKIIDAIGPSVGTMRIVTLANGCDVTVLGAFWKIPKGQAVADNLWRGSYFAALDHTTGSVKNVRSGTGPGATAQMRHPDTGLEFKSLQLPFWEETLHLTKSAHTLLPGLSLIGWDVAMGLNGPVLIEANSNPSIELLQLGHSKGIMNDSFPAICSEIISENKIMQKNRKKSRNRLLRDHLKLRFSRSFGIGGSNLDD
ncbi:MAG: sugar-transfer associated ATP-grasp domain-containing protein [Planktomarina sp.]